MMSGIHEGDLLVDTDGDMSGIVEGNVVVASGRRVTVSGIVEGDVIVERDADVTVSGIVNGVVRGDGAVIRITGMVSG